VNLILNHLPILVGAAVGAVVLLVLGSRVAKAARRASSARIATMGLVVPAAMGLAMSASTSYRYFGVHLDVTDVPDRLAMCGVAEAAIIALTLHSWKTKSKGSAWLAYFFVAAQSIPAFEVSGGAGGVVRIVLGPLMLALMLHKMLGIEAKLSGSVSTGLFASAGRELRERIVSRLGIGRRGADSAEIARNRAGDKAVRLATKKKCNRRSYDRLAAAIDAAQYGLDADAAAAAERAIVTRIVRKKSVMDLRGIEGGHVWATTTVSARLTAPQEIVEPDSTPDSSAPVEPVISGWSGPRVSGRRRPRRAPRTLRPARVQQAPQTAPERPEPALEPVRVDTVEPEPAAPSQGGKRRPSVRPAVIALRAQNPDMPTDTIAEILGVAERTVTRHLSAKEHLIEQANGASV